jgi:CBS domain-containing protein
VKQIMTGAPAHKSSSHPRAAPATVTDVMRPPLTTVGQYDHVAAAAYLMKHANTTALMVVNARTGQPAGIITEADIARAIADGKEVNDVRVYAVMITRPAVNATTSIRDAANIMTARHLRHLPVAGDAGLLGVIGITDVCRALASAGEDDRSPVADPDRAVRPGLRAHHRRPASAPSPGLATAPRQELAGPPARRRDHPGTYRA